MAKQKIKLKCAHLRAFRRIMGESEYLRWILFGKRTLDSARGDLGRDDYNWACFKSQQRAEFAVKALLKGPRAAKTLDKQHAPTRYPSTCVKGSSDEYYGRKGF